MLAVIFAAAGYLFGSISSAIVVCRIFGLKDPRQSGSGNPGATNVLRLGGKRAAMLTLVGDVLKGTLPVAVAQQLIEDPLVVAVTALACLLGHLFPVFFGFKGGKGVATAIGVYLGIDPLLGCGVIALWLAVAGVTRISSVSSLTSMMLAPVIAWRISQDIPVIVASAAIFALVCVSHADNIKRLIAGNESKIKLRR